MTKIVDPDSLNQSTQPSSGTEDGEVYIDTATKTIELIVYGNLDDNSPGKTSGVTGQAFYSFLKEEWKTDTDLNKFRFPIKAFTKFEFQWINGWAPANDQTRDLLRDCGWIESVGAADGDQYAGLVSLGDIDAPSTDQAYYQQVAGFDQTTVNFDKTGEVNEAILIYDASGPTDYTSFLKLFLREQGKTYAEGNLLVDQDLSALEPTLYRFPLENEDDIKVTESDANIDSQAPYTGMTVDYLKGSGFTTAAAQSYSVGDVVQDGAGRWAFCSGAGTLDAAGAADYTNNGGTGTFEAYAGERQIGTDYYAFNRVIEGNNGTAEEIYEWAQRQLRKSTDINDDTMGSPNQNGYGTVYGNVAKDLLTFVGDTLQTLGGVYIDGFNVNDQNRLEFSDITVDGGGLDTEDVPVTTTKRTFPYVAAGTIVFSNNLVDETNADTLYRMYFRWIRQHASKTDIGISAASGSNADIDSTTTDLSNISTNDYFSIDGMTNSENNGLWQATENFATTGGNADKVDGQTVVNETAGASVTLEEKPFESPDAVVVNDSSGPSAIEGQVTQKNETFDFDYTNNVQGGRAANEDAYVVVIAQGLEDSEWIEGLFVITQATGLSFPINAGDERNYSNPT